MPSNQTDRQKQWFVMRDLKRPNAKLPAYVELQENGLEVYTPLVWRMSTKNGRKVREQVPVIRDLLFVHDSRDIIESIIENIPTLQFRYLRGAYLSPMIVRDDDMERFLCAVKSTDSPKYFTPDELTPEMCGREVRIIDGPMCGASGRLLKVEGSNRKHVIIELPGLLAVGVKVKSDFIELQ